MTDLNRQQFEEDLAAIAAGEGEAVERHLDLLSESEEARDLRHDATRIAGEVAALGEGYKHADDFELRLMDRLDASQRDSEGGTPVQSGSSKDAVRSSGGQAKSEAAMPRGRQLLWAGGAAAAAATVLLVASTQFGDSGPPGAEGTSGKSPSGVLAAEIVQSERSANDGETGISVNGEAVAVGFRMEPGDTIATDSRTRIVLQLSDESEITLAAASVLLLDSNAPRTVELAQGELVADVSHLERGPHAIYRIPNARIEVLGTKFSLTADQDHGNLRVLRGTVALHSGNQVRTEVRAGEEAVVDAGAEVKVSPALALMDSIRWSELGPASEEDRGGSGFGELRAYKPGQERDKDWPMALEKHHVSVRLVGNIARTEIEEVFRNDSSTVLEGVYKFPLPAGAQIDRLALDVDGAFEEGAIVEKGRASKIWKGVIAKATDKKPKRPQEVIWVPGPWRDPALLEWQEGNRFELRIYPIPKQGTRTIKLAYTQVISPQGARRRYTYALPRSADGSSVAENFSFNMELKGAKPDSLLRTPGYDIASTRDGDRASLHFSSEAFVPNGDLVVDYLSRGQGSELRGWGFQGAAAVPPSVAKGRRQGPRKEVLIEQERLSSDGRAYALLAIRPVLPRWAEQRGRDFVIVVDSSQSMVGERYQRATEAATALVAEMEGRDRALVMACDLDCQSFGDDEVRAGSNTARELAEWFTTIEPSGASFLEHSLQRAAQRFTDKSEERERVVVYIGDGVASMGHRSLAVLSSAVTDLRADYDTSFTTVSIGADADSRMLGTIARAGGGYFIERKSGQKPTHMAQAVLESTMGVALRDAEVILPPGISEVSPQKLGTLRAGEELLVSGRYQDEIDGKVILRGTVGGKAYENSFPLHLALTASSANAFVPKMWAMQTIERLETEGAAGHRDTVVALSKSFGVMSKQTSLLVLESEAMFKAFGVDRAKPLVQWTGEEGDAEVSESVGAVGYGEMGGVLSSGLGGRKKDSIALGSGKGKGPTKKSAKPKQDDRVGRELLDQRGEETRKSRLSRRPNDRRGGQWMRRVWRRVPSVGSYTGVHQNIRDAVEEAERALTMSPDSRDRHRDLIQALSYAEDLGRAEEVARGWLQRDRLDPEALAYLADIAARRGRRDESIRTLSGVVDLRPDDQGLHRRLARAYERAGDRSRSCAHRVVLAELDPGSANLLADAIRCEVENGRRQRADAILAASAVAVRGRAEHGAGIPQSPERIRGDLRIDASWTGGSDLDIAIITPTGRRISWQGGHRRVVAQDVKQIGRETLGLTRIRKGNYLIEISRTHPESAEAVHGEVRVQVLGRQERIPFDLHASSAVVGRIGIRMISEMVPL